MTLRSKLYEVLDLVTLEGCNPEEEELVRVIFERTIALRRDDSHDDWCDTTDDLDD